MNIQIIIITLAIGFFVGSCALIINLASIIYCRKNINNGASSNAVKTALDSVFNSN